MAVPQQPISIAASLDSQTLVATVSGNIQKHSIKKKKVLNTEENDLFELTQAAGIAMDQEVFKVVLDLLKMNVAPLAVFQMLKAMCAGQRVSDASSAESLPNTHQSGLPESRVRSKSSCVPAGSQAPAERSSSSRDSSGQRVPRQPSASRLQKSAKGTGVNSSAPPLAPS
ncbi:mitotic-spindle organizing protein 2 isoform X2 [Polypterus senegalus]|uniref:mitotic-spindle organizing protein 2 isoform X2 n=1 Tax=Polypterus senegalus TaxID=55291 RepID=UPI0019633B6D|nr:mitotic-spindle organizing protein 2 isoform X2 [Polypterus senegalus]